jgi:hypothetical protein
MPTLVHELENSGFADVFGNSRGVSENKALAYQLQQEHKSREHAHQLELAKGNTAAWLCSKTPTQENVDTLQAIQEKTGHGRCAALLSLLNSGDFSSYITYDSTTGDYLFGDAPCMVLILEMLSSEYLKSVDTESETRISRELLETIGAPPIDFKQALIDNASDFHNDILRDLQKGVHILPLALDGSARGNAIRIINQTTSDAIRSFGYRNRIFGHYLGESALNELRYYWENLYPATTNSLRVAKLKLRRAVMTHGSLLSPRKTTYADKPYYGLLSKANLAHYRSLEKKANQLAEAEARVNDSKEISSILRQKFAIRDRLSTHPARLRRP